MSGEPPRHKDAKKISRTKIAKLAKKTKTKLNFFFVLFAIFAFFELNASTSTLRRGAFAVN